MSAIDTVLAALRSPEKEREGQWMAFCPAHADGQKAGRRSLAVAASGDGKVALRCFAGCETAAIVSAVGLRMTDLFDGPPQDAPKGRAKRPKGLRPTHVFDYTDAVGNILYAKERYEWRDGNGVRHKDFVLRAVATPAQVAEPGDRRWIWTDRDGTPWLCGSKVMDGIDPVLYRLPDVVRQVAGAGRVYVVEGEGKAHDLEALAYGADRPIVATSHHGAAGAKWTPGQIDTLRGARVVILPDHDVPGAQYAARLAPQLAGVGCELRVVELPGLAEKQDVSDWIAARRARGLPAEAIREELERIVSEAPVWTPAERPRPQSATAAVLERDSDVCIARALLEELTVRGVAPVHDEGDLYQWAPDTGLWGRLHRADVVRHASAYDGRIAYDRKGNEAVIGLSRGRVLGIVGQVCDLAHSAGWFAARPAGLACADGWLTISPDGAVEAAPLSPEHRARHSLTIPARPSRPWYELAPRWCSYLAEVLARDPTADDTARMLAEFAGAALFGLAPRYERCLVLYGAGANGKSVFLSVLQSLFTPSSVTALSPDKFGRTFLLAALAGGVQLNCVNEVPNSDTADGQTFKRVISGQAVTAEYKGRDAFTFSPTAAHVFAANELPTPADLSDGQFRRWLIALFDRRFEECEMDRGILARLAEERAGIVAWAVDGAQRLVRNGRYTVSERSEQVADEWRETSDWVLRWIREELPDQVPEDDAWTPARELYTRWREWAREGGHPGMTETTFGRRLRTLGYEMARRRPHPGAKLARCYPLRLQGRAAGGDHPWIS